MGKSEVVQLTCPNCAAILPAPAGPGPITCSYCGHQFEYVPPAPDVPAPDVPVPDVPMSLDVADAVPNALRNLRWTLLSSIIIPLIITGIVGVAALHDHFEAVHRHHWYLWDDVGGPPVAVTIAGAEAVCGRIRMIHGGKLAIQCADSRTLKVRWRFGHLGTYSQAYRATHFAAVGGRMVVSDWRGKIHLLDVATGKQVGEVAVTDRVAQFCAIDAHHVWARVVDHRNVRIDVAAATSTVDAKPPAGCPAQFAEPPTHTLKTQGFEGSSRHVDGDVGVAGGHKSPGTAYPMAVGFDPHTHAVRWKVRLGASARASVRERSNKHDALAGGRYITAYGVGEDAWRVAALDAKTGAVIWDVPLRPLFSVDEIGGLVATAHFVYVVRTSSLDVLDAKTGKLTGTIGHETYKDQMH